MPKKKSKKPVPASRIEVDALKDIVAERDADIDRIFKALKAHGRDIAIIAGLTAPGVEFSDKDRNRLKKIILQGSPS